MNTKKISVPAPIVLPEVRFPPWIKQAIVWLVAAGLMTFGLFMERWETDDDYAPTGEPTGIIPR